MSKKKIHYNAPQLIFHLINCSINICFWGRGTGKSTGAIAPFTYENARAMPRGLTGIVGATYEQILTRTLPPLIKGWEMMGFKQNKHFFVRKFAPKAWGWDLPYQPPGDPKHFIHTITGHGFMFISQDREGLANGASFDSVVGDEAKLLNEKRFKKDLVPAIRGNADKFGHLDRHGSILLCTDMPTTPKESWVLKYEDEFDPEVIEAILAVQAQVIGLKQRLEKAQGTTIKRLQRKIDKHLELLKELREDAVYISYADTFDNVHMLGFKAIRNMRRILSDLEYNTSVLNQKIDKIENGFYGGFDEDRHYYTKSNHDFLDTIEDVTNLPERDCRWDGDVMRTKPLDISADYNSKINTLVVGQRQGNTYRVLNHLFVKDELKLKDVVKKFCEYYKYHPTKVVNYYYDHTAINTSASSDYTFAQEYKDLLRASGWVVVDKYVGQASGHMSRFHFFSKLFDGYEEGLPTFKMNRENCFDLGVSLQTAAVKQTRKGFEKDKSSERPHSGVKPEQATHASEALDCLAWGAIKLKGKSNSSNGAIADTLGA